MDDQREINGWRMEPVVNEPLGDVHGDDLVGEALVREDRLVHAGVRIGDLVMVLEFRPDIVRVEHRQLGRALEPVPAHAQNVGEALDPDQHVAEPAGHPPDARRPGAVQPVNVAVFDHARVRQERFQNFLDRHRPGAGAAAAVRGGEGLVQVHLHDVHAHVARPGNAHQRVQVCAVHVKQAADRVDRLGDFGDVRFKQAERVRVGEHEPRHRAVQVGGQQLGSEHAVLGFHLHHVKARERRAGRVGTVRGVGQ